MNNRRAEVVIGTVLVSVLVGVSNSRDESGDRDVGDRNADSRVEDIMMYLNRSAN